MSIAIAKNKDTTLITGYLSRSVSVPLYQKTFYVPILSYVKHTRSVEPHSKLRGVKRLRTSHVTSAQLPRHAQWRPRHLPVSHDCASHLPHDGATNSLLESCWSDGSIPLIEGEGLSHRRDKSCPTLRHDASADHGQLRLHNHVHGRGRLHDDHGHERGRLQDDQGHGCRLVDGLPALT